MSIVKGVFFINIRSKIFRGIGITIAVLMFIVSITLIVFSAFFSNGVSESRSADIFGYNLYIVKNASFESLPQSSIAVSQKVSASELSPEYLIVYKKFNSEEKTLGKVNEVFITDGVYSCDVTDENGSSVTVSEGQLVGEVVYYSQLLGDIILFARSPMGILVIAILPCLAIILLDIIKAIISRLPPPEVIPVKKNEEPEQSVQSSNTIKVNDDGNASYSSAKKPLTPESVQDVLFTRNKVYSHTNDSKVQYVKPTAQPQRAAAAAPQTVKNTYKPPVSKASDSKEQSANAATVTAKTVQNAYLNAAKTELTASEAKSITVPQAEKAAVPEHENKGFFASRKAKEPPVLKNPHEAKQKKEIKPIDNARNLADLEESLIYTHTKNKTEPKVHSSDVIAGIKPDSLLREDNDDMDKKRYSVDDILAGLEKK